MSFALTQLAGFMAGGGEVAPALQGTPATTSCIGVTSLACNLPTGIAAGEGLILLWGGSQRNPTASGYTVLYNDDAGAGGRISLLYKTATGSEGATITVSWSGGAAVGDLIAFRVSPWLGTIDANTSVAASANPPSRAAPWGTTAPTLWIAHLGQQPSSPSTVTAAPSGYVNLNNGPGMFCSFATTVTTAASEDPGVFTTSGAASGPMSNTVAIKGVAAA